LTQRKLNFDDTVIHQLNQVIRVTALYFAVAWTTGADHFRRLDCWIRMRLRALRKKRKRRTDNYRLPNKAVAKLGLLSRTDCVNHAQAHS
jgi:hypothetical protein